MKRREFIKSVAFAAGLSILPKPLLAATASAATKPNILLIMVDDLGYLDLSCQGAKDIKTPRIDKLAKSGIRFTAGYVTAPQCGPSRAGLMTGMSQSRFGYKDNRSQSGLPPKDYVQTLPEQLKSTGYTTGMIGKWHIGSVRTENKASVHFDGNTPWDRGFDYTLMMDGGSSHYFPYRADGIKWMVTRNYEPRLLLKKDADSAPRCLDDLPGDTYLTDSFSDHSAKFIEGHKDKPWFLFLSNNAPHTPCVAKKDKLKKFAHIKDKKRRVLAAMMDSVDEGVAQVLKALKDTGQEKNTIVWFLSDNGGPTTKNGSRNDPFSGFKGDMHEGGIRVPFMVSWPGTIDAGQVVDEPVISLDILPTSLAGAGKRSLSAVHEGKNLLPWMKDNADYPDRQIAWTWRSASAIRIGALKETRNWKDVKSVDGKTVPKHAFSNLDENPKELQEKALKDPKQKQMLSSCLDKWLLQIEADQKKITPLLKSLKEN